MNGDAADAAPAAGGPASWHSVNDLAAALDLDDNAYRRALDRAALAPSPGTWLTWLDRFLATAGALLIVAGVVAFFAWNWADLHRLAKLAMVQGGLVATAALAWRLGLDTTGGRASLLAAAMLVGTVFAVFGQVYQTGADPYGLFVVWAAFTLPLALIGRQAGLWLLLVVLVNLAVLLYWIQVLYPPEGWWLLTQLLGPLVWLTSAIHDSRLGALLFAVNVLAVAIWEMAAWRGRADWLRNRWLPRLVALMAVYTVLGPTLLLIFAASLDERLRLAPPLLSAAVLPLILWFYRYRKPDLFMLTMALFGGILVIMAVAIRFVFTGFASLLLLALMLVALVGGAAAWLRKVAAEGATA